MSRRDLSTFNFVYDGYCSFPFRFWKMQMKKETTTKKLYLNFVCIIKLFESHRIKNRISCCITIMIILCHVMLSRSQHSPFLGSQEILQSSNIIMFEMRPSKALINLTNTIVYRLKCMTLDIRQSSLSCSKQIIILNTEQNENEMNHNNFVWFCFCFCVCEF